MKHDIDAFEGLGERLAGRAQVDLNTSCAQGFDLGVAPAREDGDGVAACEELFGDGAAQKPPPPVTSACMETFLRSRGLGARPGGELGAVDLGVVPRIHGEALVEPDRLDATGLFVCRGDLEQVGLDGRLPRGGMPASSSTTRPGRPPTSTTAVRYTSCSLNRASQGTGKTMVPSSQCTMWDLRPQNQIRPCSSR